MIYTYLLLGLTTVIWIAFDVWVVIRYGNEATISVRMLRLGRAYPIIPFALGVLIGHFYASQIAVCTAGGL